MPQHPTGFLAHSENKAGKLEPLRKHIACVARTARSFAAVFGAGDQAYAMGLLHDVGKYSDRFQRRVLGQSQSPAGSHSIVGALLALVQYRKMGCFPAAAIAGHHGGIDSAEWNPSTWAKELYGQLKMPPLKKTDLDDTILRFRADGFVLPGISEGLIPSDEHISDDMLDTRMLFSTLVDADFVETEAHFEGDAAQPRRYRPTGPGLDPQEALNAVEKHITSLPDGDHSMGRIRQTLHQQCLQAANQPTGLFTLSAPTGSGKTLSMLAFALKHAATHNLRRIVLVMPYLNIIDQTADLYRDLFSEQAGFAENYVLEDHSLASLAEDDDQAPPNDNDRTRRLLAENWDAPIILTTTLRCLESLASNKPSACRKLHRLASSVILFDEVQTLPKDLAVATLANLSRLASRFGSTVVFATATQPAFDQLDPAVTEICRHGWNRKPIVEAQAEAELFSATAGRTKVHWDHRQPATLEAMAQRLVSETSHQWMCIVNVKRHAHELFERLSKQATKGLIHLSTSMCPAHRQQVLEDIRTRLDSGQSVRLISTQCVEAGVDVDFAVVFRAMGPLESIAQAAGRCNRHGRRPEGGRLHVFKPVDDDGNTPYPPKAYAYAAKETETFVNARLDQGHDPDSLIHDPQQIAAYYRQLYTLSGTGQGTDQRAVELCHAMEAADFAKYASKYQLIDTRTINILTPYDRAAFDSLAKQIEQILSAEKRTPGQLRAWIAAARRHSVAHFYNPESNDPIFQFLHPIYFSQPGTGNPPADWFIPTENLKYDENTGLIPPTENKMIL